MAAGVVVEGCVSDNDKRFGAAPQSERRLLAHISRSKLLAAQPIPQQGQHPGRVLEGAAACSKGKRGAWDHVLPCFGGCCKRGARDAQRGMCFNVQGSRRGAVAHYRPPQAAK